MSCSHPAPSRARRRCADFGKVAVLLGGDSSEREISLLSGNAVLAALKRRGVDAHAFDPQREAGAGAASEGFERAWIALHGPGGEDGSCRARSSGSASPTPAAACSPRR
jgi:D-alanine-D-alanine ligase-like ATP-grasp enzyme